MGKSLQQRLACGIRVMSLTAREPSYCAGRLRRRSSRRPGNGVGSTVPYTVTMHLRCKVCLYLRVCV
ncbi:unnamed protein product [Ectocarpus sp. CCAP 1310/34]|nr:unnamed protein product [Ectocarpus sp. CCAP 1310/34]